jgi:hypothetical protein
MCLQYEQECSDSAAASEMLENGATLMAALIRANQSRPWWDQMLSQEDRVILMNTYKDTGFVVGHWQCSDKPGYKPIEINHQGHVWLYGDVGSWSGSYGGWVQLPDLLRYARQTVRGKQCAATSLKHKAMQTPKPQGTPTQPPEGVRTPDKPGFSLSPEVIKMVDEQSQYFVDHIQRRDRAWTEGMDVFRSRHD